jgi:hypothetical protein
MTYRRFYTPKELVGEFLDRLEAIEAYVVAKDIKHWALMRYVKTFILQPLAESSRSG